MVRVIVNASPIIGLSKIGKLNILWEIFDEIYISEEARDEIFTENTEKAEGKKELENAIKENKIKIYRVKDCVLVERLFGKLHKGELETIVGGQELEVDFVIIDEIGARNLARVFSLIPVGVVGVLIMAKKKGKLDEIKPLLNKLIENNFRLSRQIINEALKETGEN